MLLQVGVYVRVCDYFGTHLHTYKPTHNTHNLDISLCLPLPHSRVRDQRKAIWTQGSHVREIKGVPAIGRGML